MTMGGPLLHRVTWTTGILVCLCYLVTCGASYKLKRLHKHHQSKARTAENEVRTVRSNAEPTLGKSGESLSDGPKQKWDYVKVRPHAFMFWWLYYTTHADGYKQRPLVIWLQGGPGASSTGFGNFQEIGPENVDLKPRQSTWLSEASLLFVDNPVGTGYSYVTSDDAYTTDVTTIADDLVVMIKAFLKEVPDFQTIPLYIFSESYGGKMNAAFSKSLYKEVTHGLKCDFRGMAMGDSWISPIDSVLSWGPYLYSTSLLDKEGLMAINKVAMTTKKAVKAGDWLNATNLWAELEDLIANKTNNVNVYNIINPSPPLDNQDNEQSVKKPQRSELHKRVLRKYRESLDELMNGPIKQKLRIIPANVTWGGQAGEVFKKQMVDFMKPVVDIVDDLLKETNLKVVVFSGQLDMIVDTIGTEAWVQRLTWPDLVKYEKARRVALLSEDRRTSAFVKSYGNFSFYWIMNSGHMVPTDQPETGLQMLRRVIG